MERENIARAARGDANAFETLMGAYEKKIYALCLRMMGNPHDGEDAAQEAMLRIWRTIGQYRFESAFSTWVYRVTASCCMDAIRKRQRHEQPSLEEMGEASGFDPADGGETPQEQTERKETWSAIRQAIAAVPEGNGNAVWLRPELVCVVQFMERTAGGGMRQPVFKGLRQDKTPQECVEAKIF